MWTRGTLQQWGPLPFTPSFGPHPGPLSLKPFQNVFILSCGLPKSLPGLACLGQVVAGEKLSPAPVLLCVLQNQHPVPVSDAVSQAD